RLPRSRVERAQTKMTVRDERAHPELAGEPERVPVVGLGVLPRIAPGGDLPEDPQGRHLVAALPALATDTEGALRQAARVLEPVGEHARVGEEQHERRPGPKISRLLEDTHRPFQQPEALLDAPGARVRVTETRGVTHREPGHAQL